MVRAIDGCRIRYGWWAVQACDPACRLFFFKLPDQIIMRYEAVRSARIDGIRASVAELYIHESFQLPFPEEGRLKSILLNILTTYCKLAK